MAEINDPVFGRLMFDDLWEGRVSLEAFECNAVLVVKSESATQLPDEGQRNAFQWLLKTQKGLRPIVEDALFGYYRRILAGMAADPFPEPLPPLPANPSGIWRHVYLEDTVVFVPYQRDPEPRLYLAWNCEWDEEHGVEVLIEGGRVSHVGQQNYE